MQLAPSEARVHFGEPVRSVLRRKSRVVWSIGPDATVYDAIAQMAEKQVGALVVLTGGMLAGIVTERDYARKVTLQGRQSRDTKVREIMSSPVLYVTPEQTIDECLRLITARRIRHLPVLEGDRVAGMVSIGDLVNWIVAAEEQTSRHLRSHVAYPI